MSDTSAMTGPIAAWHTEHVYFSQLLHLLQREVDVFHTGERPNYELMYDIVSYLHEYSDGVHHPARMLRSTVWRSAAPTWNSPSPVWDRSTG